MSKKIIDKVIAGIAISAMSYFSWQGYSLYSQHHIYSNFGKDAPSKIIKESCANRLYSQKTPDIFITPQTSTSQTTIDLSTTIMKESCTYNLYSLNNPHLKVCTATPALDCSYDGQNHAAFQRTCTSSTINAEIQRLEDGFKRACALSSAPDNDLLLTMIKKERDQLFRNDSFYVLCEEWECSRIEKCYQEDCVPCGKAEIKSSPCISLFPDDFWKTQW